MKTLVIGYGSTLHRDDGVGPVVAQQLAMWNLPRVQSLAVHQLTPELAESISRADLVCFVDAWFPTSDLTFEKGRVERIIPNSSQPLDHHYSPSLLLHWSQRLYGRQPSAYHILIPAIQLDYGESLSPSAIRGVYWAIQTVKTLIAQEAYCYA